MSRFFSNGRFQNNIEDIMINLNERKAFIFMASPALKLLLVKKTDEFKTGLQAIRARASEFIDISEYETAMSDATSVDSRPWIIKDNKVYMTMKVYFDLDNNCRILLAQEDIQKFDQWPIPQPTLKIVDP